MHYYIYAEDTQLYIKTNLATLTKSITEINNIITELTNFYSYKLLKIQLL